MSTTAHPSRKTALVAGVFYLLTFVSSIPAVLLLAPVLDNARYIVGAGADTRVLLGCLLDLVNAIACIGTAVALFPVVKRQSESVALGFVTSRVMEAAVIVIGVVSLLAVVTLRRSIGGPGTDDPSLLAVGRGLVAVRDWTFLLGPTLAAGINALLLGSLMRRARLVPAFIPLLGLIGGPLLLLSVIVDLFNGNDRVVPLAVIGTVPIFLWELLLGLRLAFKGFQSPSLTPSPT